MRKILFLISLSLLSIVASAQKVAYRLGFDVLFDNIENSNKFFAPRTEFAVKIAPEVGLHFASYHRVMVGVNLMQNLGSSQFPTQFDFTAYYQFQNKGFNVVAGLFPNTYTGDYPKSFFRTNYDFFNANIRGLLFSHKSDKGFVELMCDWYLLDNERQSDGFTMAAKTEYGFWNRYLLLGGAVLMNHFKDAEFLQNCSLLERVQYNAYVGTDLRAAIPAMDKFAITVGVLGSTEHKRGQGSSATWANGVGVQIGLDLVYKGFNFTNTCYWGGEQQIYYHQYGASVYSGSPFYNANFYDRAEVGYTYKWSFLKVTGALVFHCTSKQVAAQQMVRLSVNFDDIFKSSKKD